MKIALALSGWAAAVLAAGLWLRANLTLRARGEGVARASHELRGPLTALRLGLALGSQPGGLSERQLRAMEGELERASLALTDLGRAPGGSRRSAAQTPVDLRALLADSVEAWRPCAAAAGVELDLRWIGERPRVRGDQVRLAQATGNLIANAIEHGGGHVRVTGRGDDARACIEVSDDGPGLPAPVGRLARRARGGRGARGRGLAIAAGVAVAHGGRLEAGDGQGGARLVLELPAHRCGSA